MLRPAVWKFARSSIHPEAFLRAIETNYPFHAVKFAHTRLVIKSRTAAIRQKLSALHVSHAAAVQRHFEDYPKTLVMHAQCQAADTLLKEPLNTKEEHRRDARFEQHG